jgi:hypothetical protein
MAAFAGGAGGAGCAQAQHVSIATITNAVSDLFM